MTDLNIEKIYEGIRKSLKDFSPSTTSSYTLTYDKSSSKFNIERKEIPVPELILFTLSNVINCKTFGVGEKIRWEVPFNYKKNYCTFALQKFGLRLYLLPSGKNGEDLFKIKNEIIGKLTRAILKIEKLVLKPFAQHQITEQNFTIANNYHKLENRYAYFRNKAEIKSLKKPDYSPKPNNDMFAGINELFELKNELFYYTIAMLDAYFSFLEHLFVLIFPFVKQENSIDLVKFISKFWSEKFKEIFDIKNDNRAKYFYDQLEEIKEHYRNYYAHGEFEKSGASLYFHVPGLGAIPAQLSNIRNKPHFNFFPVEETNLTHICKVIDQFNEWLVSDHSYVKFIVKYARSGLDLSCAPKNIQKINNSMKSEKEFENLLEHYCHLTDMHDNMDY